MPNRWAYDITHVSKEEIFRYCVQDDAWQEFRLSMKGTPTTVKLDMLESWKEAHRRNDKVPRRVQVQVDNYINALKRGGQLTLNGLVAK